MAKLEFDTLIVPEKLIIAHCSVCKKEIKRTDYGHYEDFKRQKSKLEKSIFECPYCDAVFIVRATAVCIPWEKTKDGDYIAKAQNGDFLVWKYGYGYKWRYRKYGAQSPEQIHYVRTKAEAQKACMRHPEWKLGDDK